ncbi:unnamed protein product [Clonostachys solani]|uniref:Uncharacterized protein n=1 Tax=Clonostachys solani TaxID=160281 RepID=A0A9N9ZER9_9HYPO|nr:unnamed protein product [Clonostachys solani]
MVSGRDFRPDSDISSKLIQCADLHTDPFTGFTLLFPLKSHGEEGIGGKIHRPSSSIIIELKIKPLRGRFTFTVQDVDAVPGLRQRMSDSKAKSSAIHILKLTATSLLKDSAKSSISHPGHPCDGWLNHGQPMADGKTLLEVLDEREFFIVASFPEREVSKYWGEGPLPPSFRYDQVYGSAHDWEINGARQNSGEPLPSPTSTRLYRANRDELERLRRKDAELVHIAGMEPVATVNSFRGLEGDIIFVVRGCQTTLSH